MTIRVSFDIIYEYETVFPCNRKGGSRLSSFSLRLLALICMCADHAGLALFPSVGAFRCVGRIAFPLYCFLLVQGYAHTRDLRGYARRLLLTAVLSEIPFDLLIFGQFASPAEQNVLFALLLSLMALYAFDRLRSRPLHAWLAILSLCLAAMAANISYGWLGIALSLCIHYAGQNKLRLALSVTGILALYSLSLFLSGVAQSWVFVSFCAPLSVLPMLLYSGRRGPRHPALNFLFYASYPLHLAALVIIRMLRIIPPYFFG